MGEIWKPMKCGERVCGRYATDRHERLRPVDQMSRLGGREPERLQRLTLRATAVEGPDPSTTSVTPADSESVDARGRLPKIPTRALLIVARRRLSPAVRSRLAVAGVCYALLVFFGVVAAVVRLISPWSWAVALGVAAAVTAPLALAFIYDRLSALKTPWFEISLAAGTVQEEGRFASALEDQTLYGGPSANPQLIESVAALTTPDAPKVLVIDLRTRPYWWSTRIFLLAALTEDYTAAKRLVFVEGGAARLYVGMATPSAVRVVFAARFSEYEPAYLSAKKQEGGGEPEWRVASLVGAWQQSLWEATEQTPKSDHPDEEGLSEHPDQEGLREHEESVKEYVTSAELFDWLTEVLDTSSIAWDGWLEDPRLRARILGQDESYVALVQDGRLGRVVNRDDLALAVSRQAMEAASLV